MKGRRVGERGGVAGVGGEEGGGGKEGIIENYYSLIILILIR
jgi:hypothetical protein